MRVAGHRMPRKYATGASKKGGKPGAQLAASFEPLLRTCFSLALQLDSPDKHLNIRLSTPPFLLLPTPPLVYFMPNTAAHYSAELVGPPPLPPPPIESWIWGISSLASADQGNFPAGGGHDRVSSGDAPANPASRCDNCLALGWLQVGKRSVEKGGRSAPAIVILVPSV